MEPKVNYVMVGGFVILLGAVLVAVIFWLGKGFDRNIYDRYYAYMEESVAGLSVNASVKYRGVEVGRVKDIVLNPDNPEQVRLTLDIVRGTPIKRDTLAILDVQGLTGLAIVDLTGGSRDSPPLTPQPGADYPVIKTGPSLLLRFDRATTRLLTNLNRVSENLNALLDEKNRVAISQLLTDMSDLSRILSAKKQQFNAGITNAAQAMEYLAQTSRTLNEEMPLLLERLYGSTEALETMAEKIGRTSSTIGTVVEDARPGITQFSRQTVNELTVLVSELRQLTATMQRTAQELEQQPTALIFGRRPPPRGPGE